MKKISKIYCDLDSTLCNFLEYVCNRINKMYGLAIELYPEMIDRYDYFQLEFGDQIKSVWSTSGIYDNHIQPYTDAPEFIANLRNLVGGNNIIIITSGPIEVQEEKTRFCKNNFGISNVIHASTKWPHCVDGIIVDDYHKHIDEFTLNLDREAILFNYDDSLPYVSNGLLYITRKELVKYCTSYNDILEEIKKLI